MTNPMNWQKSTFSDGSDGDTCVELATTRSRIHLRESESLATELTTAPAALARLFRTVKASRP